MVATFGFLSRLYFLQNWTSVAISRVSPHVFHNVEKYYALMKVHYLSALGGVEGDYLEFGLYQGSSFCHSIRCHRRILTHNPALATSRFFGFDSFAVFGELPEFDQHHAYKDNVFSTSRELVERRVRRVANGVTYKLIGGYYKDSLKAGPAHYGIDKARIVFIDCDTYTAAKEALTFCMPIMQVGTYVILDDYLAYGGDEGKGELRAFDEFVDEGRLKVRPAFTYGMGSAVMVVAGRR